MFFYFILVISCEKLTNLLIKNKDNIKKTYMLFILYGIIVDIYDLIITCILIVNTRHTYNMIIFVLWYRSKIKLFIHQNN